MSSGWPVFVHPFDASLLQPGAPKSMQGLGAGQSSGFLFCRKCQIRGPEIVLCRIAVEAAHLSLSQFGPTFHVAAFFGMPLFTCSVARHAQDRSQEAGARADCLAGADRAFEHALTTVLRKAFSFMCPVVLCAWT